VSAILDTADLPPIFCPLESAINPRVLAVEDRAIEWINSSGMCASDQERASVIATHSADFYARFAPTADADRLLAAALWVYWGFAFDDARCDNGPLSDRPSLFNALAGRVQRAVEAPSYRDADPYAASVRDIAERFRLMGPPAQVRRFTVAHRAWLSGVSWQIGNQAAGRMPDLDEFMTMRLLSSGGEPTFAMLELATGEPVPDQEFDRPAVRALTEMAICVAAMDNDRHSLRKEMAHGHTEQNIYSVLMHHRGMSFEEAALAATRLRDRVLLRFMELHDHVRPQASAALARYLQGLRHGVRGNAEWGLRVPRYLSLGWTPDGMDDMPLEWAPAPSDTGREAPAGLPSVAWWWDEDL
jgi:hypothetical protein